MPYPSLSWLRVLKDGMPSFILTTTPPPQERSRMPRHPHPATPARSSPAPHTACPHCGHGLLFHHRELTNDPGALGYLSYDYCLMCSRRFHEQFGPTHQKISVRD